MTLQGYDRRLTPARADLAAARLRGQVAAARFVDGRAACIAVELADLRQQPRSDAALATQLLHGEDVTVYEESEGWAWVQAEDDGYVGYLLAEALGPPQPGGHRVAVNRTFIYPAADMKRPPAGALPLGARVAAAERIGDFLKLRQGGFVWASHLVPFDQALDVRPLDFAAVAEGLIGAPYLWGGKSAAGIDCSGLVQLAAGMAGLAAPRDTDLQEASALWLTLDREAERRRGDLVFWRGHVAIMCDEESLVHASGHHMLVVREPAAAAERRIGAAVTSIRRCRAPTLRT